MRHSIYTTNADANYTENVKLALMNGCQWIKLSINESSDEDFVPVVSSIKGLCDEYHAYLIIEDSVELAKQVKANGVHLNDKENVAVVRKNLGAHYLICVTANNHDEACRLQDLGADCTDEYNLGLKSFEMTLGASSHIHYA